MGDSLIPSRGTALAGYLVSTALIAVPLLLTLRAGRQRFGVVTLLVAGVGWLTVGMIDAPAIAVAGAIGATVGALLADVLLANARLAGRYRLSGLAAATIALVWAGQLAGFAIADAVRWPVSLWAGVILLTGYAAASLGLLATPDRLRDAGPPIGSADEGAPLGFLRFPPHITDRLAPPASVASRGRPRTGIA